MKIRPDESAAPAISPEEAAVIPVHQWTNGGDEVLVVRYVANDGLSYAGKSRAGESIAFYWPLVVGAVVQCTDPVDDNKCGGGLHGWPWGSSLGAGKAPDWSATWIVFGTAPEHVRLAEDDGKIKCIGPCTIRFVGRWMDALEFVRSGKRAWIAYSARGEASTSGYSSSASTSGKYSSASSSGNCSSASTSGKYSSASSSGNCSSASSSGDYSSASTSGYYSSASSSGDYSSASSSGNCSSASSSGKYSSASSSGNYSSASSSGECSSASTSGNYSSASTSGSSSSASSSGKYSSASTSGYYSSASTSGECSPAVCAGLNSKAQSGPFGCIALAWWNEEMNRAEMRCAEVGCGDGSDGKLKSGMWYRVDESGSFVEVHDEKAKETTR